MGARLALPSACHPRHPRGDRAAGIARPAAGQQRLLGYLPHQLARLSPARPRARRRTARRHHRRLPRFGMDEPLVGARACRHHGRHQLGRDLRRCRRPWHRLRRRIGLCRGATQRPGAEFRSAHRTQGPGPRPFRRLYRPGHPRGFQLVDRERQLRCRAGRLGRPPRRPGHRPLPGEPRAGLDSALRPADRFPARTRAGRQLRVRLRPAGLGRRLHRDERLGHVVLAGLGRGGAGPHARR